MHRRNSTALCYLILQFFLPLNAAFFQSYPRAIYKRENRLDYNHKQCCIHTKKVADDGEDVFEKNGDDENSLSSSRRSFFQKMASIPAQIASLAAINSEFIPEAQARGLVKFPCKDYTFLNTYHFLRAGESLLEEEGVWVTNPLFL